MRQARLRRDSGESGGSYYHLFGHAVGNRDDRPFGKVEKEKLMQLILTLDRSFTLEVLGFCVLSNHYHIVLYAPHDVPSDAEAMRCWTALYGTQAPLPALDDLSTWAMRMRDISYFGFQLQARFTCWYNRTRIGGRKGTIWNDRFKSTLLEGNTKDSSVWACLKYIELNPIRAKMVTDPADYRWSSWGQYCGSGTHLFANAFESHLGKLKGCIADDWTSGEVYGVFRAELQRTMKADAERQREQKALAHTIATAMTAESSSDERDDPSVWVRADRRVRFWTDGFAVGTKTFILELHASLKPAEDSVPEFAAGGEDQQADSFYCLQRARKKNRTVTAVPAIPSSPPSG